MPQFGLAARAGYPPTASQLILTEQIKWLLRCLATPLDDPIHHVVFSPALRDRIDANAKTHRGRPPPHWLQLMLHYLQPPINHVFPEQPSSQNPMHLNKLLQQNTALREFLVAAPTRARGLFPFLWLPSERAGRGLKKGTKRDVQSKCGWFSSQGNIHNPRPVRTWQRVVGPMESLSASQLWSPIMHRQMGKVWAVHWKSGRIAVNTLKAAPWHHILTKLLLLLFVADLFVP